jgi:hypothetical protein
MLPGAYKANVLPLNGKTKEECAATAAASTFKLGLSKSMGEAK